VDEARLPGEPPHVYVARLAAAKARAVADRAPDRPVLGADTVVVKGETVLGKPADPADAARMLELLSGRTHLVLTGVCVVAPGHTSVEVALTTVEFRSLDPAEIQWYVASGEPMDKAGGYAIQGLASRFVTRIDGSYSNVVGLPVELVVRMCAGAGILLF
jgi:septum formation protein